ncbi:CUX2 (predicted) [Pycnogonum litorale]
MAPSVTEHPQPHHHHQHQHQHQHHHTRDFSNHMQQHPLYHHQQQQQQQQQQQSHHHFRHDLIRSTSSTPSDSPASNASIITSTAISYASKKIQSGMRALNHQTQPSVYEMAALTTDLDTQIITSKIKETLLANNIGQKIFGEAVLGLSQGSVSELLSKPKPWHMLSIKGREPFIRMQLWLNDPQNIDRLQTLKNERREANKRKRASADIIEPLPPPPQSPECRSIHSSQQQSPVYANSLNSYLPSSPNSQGGNGPSAKKARVLFSEEQKEALRLAFQLDPYPSTVTIDFLASELNLSARTITNWFHNHRMRLKQLPNPVNGNSSHDSDNSKSPSPTTPPPLRNEGFKFDPLHFRMLLNQRLLDIHKSKNAAFVNSVAQMAYPFYYDSVAAAAAAHAMYLKQAEQTTTLDLSMPTHRRQSDDKSDSQDDSVASSDENDESDVSQYNSEISSAAHDKSRSAAAAAMSSSSSRRKPAAPQWIYSGLDLSSNTTEEDLEDDDDDDDGASVTDEEIINGVCVRQTEGFGLRTQSEEMIRVEPAPVPDQDGDKKSNRSGAKSKSDKADKVTAADNDRPSSTTAKILERQSNLKRLQERLDKDGVRDVEEEWEF